MPLRSARLAGDPILEACLAGTHRMLAGEQGLPVKRVQQGLIDLGRSVGPAGADGIFGPDTGAAATDYKTAKGLVPNDPVVGPGTIKALDDDLFFDPPILDPTFAEFSPSVVDHRVEPFVALELSALLNTPLDSWRHMLGTFALSGLNSGQLLGIVAQSRAPDLRVRFLAVADTEQIDRVHGRVPADVFFDNVTAADSALGRTVPFLVGGTQRAFIIVSDDVILGRASIVRQSNGTRAPVTLQGVIVHELTHVRNLVGEQALLTTLDTDTTVYADTALTQARSAVSTPTVNVLHSFVSEMVARHVHWVVLAELSGAPGSLAVQALPADRLAAAALFYFVDVPVVYDSNGYGAGITGKGDAVTFHQLDLWLQRCASLSFSDIAADDQQSTLAFQAAARFCAGQVANPTLDRSQMDGLFPLIQDFV